MSVAGILGIGGSALGVVGGLLSAGKKPKVPQFVKTDPAEEQRQSIRQNLDVLPQAQELASKTNLTNQSELMKSLRGVIPNIDAIQTQVSENLLSQLRGELPEDVANSVQRNAAGRSLYGGFGGSGAARNLVARDLGLTSLDLSNKAMDSAGRWIANARQNLVAPMMDVTSMFLTPTQRMAQTSANNQGQFQRNLAAAQVASQPNPMGAALGGVLSSVGGMATSFGFMKAFGGGAPKTAPSMGGGYNEAVAPRYVGANGVTSYE